MRRRLSCPELVGRGEELAFLGEAFERAAAGRPAVALVGGEAGVGKTRLVHELAGRVRRSGARVWTGYCPPHGEYVMPYAPIVQHTLPRRRLVDGDRRLLLRGPKKAEPAHAPGTHPWHLLLSSRSSLRP
jgi:hypothetical protein